MFSALCYGFQRGAFHHAQVIKQLLPFFGVSRLAIQQRIDGGVIEAGRPAHADAPLRQKLGEQIDGLSVLRPIGVFGLASWAKTLTPTRLGGAAFVFSKKDCAAAFSFPSGLQSLRCGRSP